MGKRTGPRMETITRWPYFKLMAASTWNRAMGLILQIFLLQARERWFMIVCTSIPVPSLIKTVTGIARTSPSKTFTKAVLCLTSLSTLTMAAWKIAQTTLPHVTVTVEALQAPVGAMQRAWNLTTAAMIIWTCAHTTSQQTPPRLLPLPQLHLPRVLPCRPLMKKALLRLLPLPRLLLARALPRLPLMQSTCWKNAQMTMTVPVLNPVSA
mmetsp:Transcript_39681/g.52314  ORF Transcript_39681/g.52314 Transcript_39681/m.52314 type:complete len:210 (+) Transcript_39681:811-1440(+)